MPRLEVCQGTRTDRDLPLTRGPGWSRFWSGANMRNLVLNCLALLATATGAMAADKIRVLILTGESDYSHPWQPNVPFMRSMLMNSGRFDVKVEEEVRGITAATLANYDLL